CRARQPLVCPLDAGDEEATANVLPVVLLSLQRCEDEIARRLAGQAIEPNGQLVTERWRQVDDPGAGIQVFASYPPTRTREVANVWADTDAAPAPRRAEHARSPCVESRESRAAKSASQPASRGR